MRESRQNLEHLQLKARAFILCPALGLWSMGSITRVLWAPDTARQKTRLLVWTSQPPGWRLQVLWVQATYTGVALSPVLSEQVQLRVGSQALLEWALPPGFQGLGQAAALSLGFIYQEEMELLVVRSICKMASSPVWPQWPPVPGLGTFPSSAFYTETGNAWMLPEGSALIRDAGSSSQRQHSGGKAQEGQPGALEAPGSRIQVLQVPGPRPHRVRWQQQPCCPLHGAQAQAVSAAPSLRPVMRKRHVSGASL